MTPLLAASTALPTTLLAVGATLGVAGLGAVAVGALRGQARILAAGRAATALAAILAVVVLELKLDGVQLVGVAGSLGLGAVALVVIGGAAAQRGLRRTSSRTGLAVACVGIATVASFVVPLAVSATLDVAGTVATAPAADSPPAAVADPTGVTESPRPLLDDAVRAELAAAQVPEDFIVCADLDAYALSCFEDVFTTLADDVGVEAAVRELVRIYELGADTQFFSYCHETIHALGVAAYTETGGDRDAALGMGDTLCSGGFQHGVWQSHFATLDDDELLADLSVTCADFKHDAVGSWACEHIIGHEIGLRGRDDINAAVEHCRQFAAVPADTLEGMRCITGVYMEYFANAEYLQTIAGMPPEEVLEVCYEAAEDMKIGCYSEAWPQILVVLQNDMARAFPFCATYAEEVWLDRCQQAVAQGVAFQEWFDPAKIVAFCTGLAETTWRDNCLEANANAVGGETASLANGLEICAAIVDPKRRSQCDERVSHNWLLEDPGHAD